MSLDEKFQQRKKLVIRRYPSAEALAQVERGNKFIVVEDEKAYPVKVSFLSAQAIVQIPNALANLIHQADRAQRSSAGFHDSFITAYLHGIWAENLDCKPFSGGSHVQIIPLVLRFKLRWSLFQTTLPWRIHAKRTGFLFDYCCFVWLRESRHC